MADDGMDILGEISVINNCSEILTDPNGEYKLSASEALKAYSTLSLYTNAEPCPMVLLPSLHPLHLADRSASVPQQFAGLASQSAFMGRVSRLWLRRDGGRSRSTRRKYLRNQRSCRV